VLGIGSDYSESRWSRRVGTRSAYQCGCGQRLVTNGDAPNERMMKQQTSKAARVAAVIVQALDARVEDGKSEAVTRAVVVGGGGW
jgi:hypothetical protein